MIYCNQWTLLREVRLFTKYDKNYENGYAVIKATVNCGGEVRENRNK